MALILRNLSGAVLSLDDVGANIAIGADYDLSLEGLGSIHTSTDVPAAITALDAIILDSASTPLSVADSIAAVAGVTAEDVAALTSGAIGNGTTQNLYATVTGQVGSTTADNAIDNLLVTGAATGLLDTVVTVDTVTVNTTFNAAFSTINTQPVLTFEDATRANKRLSIETVPYTYGENVLTNNDFIRPAGGNITDNDSGNIVPLDATLVWATGHCENTSGGDTADIEMFVNGASVGVIGSFATGANVIFNNLTLDIDVVSGDRIRLRAINVGGGDGDIEDTVVNLFFKHRG